jgi:acyl carrier protein
MIQDIADEVESLDIYGLVAELLEEYTIQMPIE